VFALKAFHRAKPKLLWARKEGVKYGLGNALLKGPQPGRNWVGVNNGDSKAHF
jgi:hypothetical protein